MKHIENSVPKIYAFLSMLFPHCRYRSIVMNWNEEELVKDSNFHNLNLFFNRPSTMLLFTSFVLPTYVLENNSQGDKKSF